MVKGDPGYILRSGGVMLGVTVVQVACAIGAVYFGARTAMALGRDVRGPCSITCRIFPPEK